MRRCKVLFAIPLTLLGLVCCVAVCPGQLPGDDWWNSTRQTRIEMPKPVDIPLPRTDYPSFDPVYQPPTLDPSLTRMPASIDLPRIPEIPLPRFEPFDSSTYLAPSFSLVGASGFGHGDPFASLPSALQVEVPRPVSIPEIPVLTMPELPAFGPVDAQVRLDDFAVYADQKVADAISSTTFDLSLQYPTSLLSPMQSATFSASMTGLNAVQVGFDTMEYVGRSMQIMNPPRLDTSITCPSLQLEFRPGDEFHNLGAWAKDIWTNPTRTVAFERVRFEPIDGGFIKETTLTSTPTNAMERVMLNAFPVGSYFDPMESTVTVRREFVQPKMQVTGSGLGLGTQPFALPKTGFYSWSPTDSVAGFQMPKSSFALPQAAPLRLPSDYTMPTFSLPQSSWKLPTTGSFQLPQSSYKLPTTSSFQLPQSSFSLPQTSFRLPTTYSMPTYQMPDAFSLPKMPSTYSQPTIKIPTTYNRTRTPGSSW